MNTIFETNRLIVKAPSLDNFEEIYPLLSDPEVMRYVGRGVKTRKEVEEALPKMVAHYKKHGFSVCDVYEKNSGKYVGRAGLIYLEMNDAQPEIEVGYTLHKNFWKKGYATELAKAFIDWGFAHLPVTKLVAVIYPENERSRRVLEKINMHYIGRAHCYGTEVAKYELEKNKINPNQIILIPAELKDYPLIQNMARFYVYDMSQYMGWEIPQDGLYECIDFKKYFEEKNSFPFLVRIANELAGFVIINKTGISNDIEWNMAQFYVIRKFQQKGLAKQIAFQVFKKFRGVWEVMVMPGNEGAYRFWRRIISQYTQNNFEESTKPVSYLENGVRNLFKFSTDKITD